MVVRGAVAIAFPAFTADSSSKSAVGRLPVRNGVKAGTLGTALHVEIDGFRIALAADDSAADVATTVAAAFPASLSWVVGAAASLTVGESIPT